MRLALAFVCCITLSLSSQAQNSGHLKLMGVQITGLFDLENPGPYNEIYEELIRGFEPAYRLRMAPLRRAITAFVKGDTDCYFFGTGMRRIYTEQGVPDEDLLISEEVNAISLRVFTREDDPIFRNADDLNGHFIALDQGAISVEGAARELALDPEKLLPAQTLSQALLLLAQKRVDAVVAFDSDMAIHKRRTGDPKKYGVSSVFTVQSSSDSVICRKTPVSEMFMKHVNERLRALKETGKLNQILNSTED